MLAERIRRNGPITFAELQDAALYDPDAGFFTHRPRCRAVGARLRHEPRGRVAVRRARGPPARRHVGRTRRSPTRSSSSTPVRAPAASRPTCCAPRPRARAALRYVLVERSPALRSRATRPPRARAGRRGARPRRRRRRSRRAGRARRRCRARSRRASTISRVSRSTGLVLANELLDNLPVRIVERTADGWDEVLVALDDDDRLVETAVPAQPAFAASADEVAAGADVSDRRAAARSRRSFGLADPGRRGAPPGRAARSSTTPRRWRSSSRAVPTAGCGRTEATSAVTRRSTRPASQDITCDLPLEHLLVAAAPRGVPCRRAR